jgi:imidazolonepropionase-like amidohydrolase
MPTHVPRSGLAGAHRAPVAPAGTALLAMLALAAASHASFSNPTPALREPIPAADPSQPQAETQAAAAEGPILLRAKRLVVRPGEVLEGVDVLVENGRIRAIGSALTAPEGTRTIEAPVVCSGYIDTWSLLGLDSGVIGDRTAGAATRMLDGIDLYGQEHLFAEALRAGVIGVRAQGALPSRLSGQGVVLRTAPVSAVDPEVRILSAASGLWVTAVDGDAFDRIEAVDRFVSAIEAGRKYAEAKVKYERELKEWQKKISEESAKLEKDFKNAKKKRDKAIADAKEKEKEFSEEKYQEDKQPKPPRFDRDNEVLAQIAAGAQPAFVQAQRLPEIKALLAALPKLGAARLVLVGGDDAHLCAAELAAAGIAVLIAPADPGSAERFGFDGLERAAVLERAGVYVLFGSGAGSPYAVRDLPLAAARAVAFGLDADSALAALTTRPARLLGLDSELGSVEVGKSADLLVLSGDPLKAATQVQLVIVRGQVVTPP